MHNFTLNLCENIAINPHEKYLLLNAWHLIVVSGNQNSNQNFSAIYMTIFSVKKLWFRNKKCANKYKTISKLLIKNVSVFKKSLNET